MSNRLDKEREEKLLPKRMQFAKNCLAHLNIEITFECKTFIKFNWKGSDVIFYPYSGWHTGKTIIDGRGIDKLLKQLK